MTTFKRTFRFIGRTLLTILIIPFACLFGMIWGLLYMPCEVVYALLNDKDLFGCDD